MYIYYLQLYTTQKNISSNNLLNSHFSYEFEILSIKISNLRICQKKVSIMQKKILQGIYELGMWFTFSVTRWLIKKIINNV